MHAVVRVQFASSLATAMRIAGDEILSPTRKSFAACAVRRSRMTPHVTLGALPA